MRAGNKESDCQILFLAMRRREDVRMKQVEMVQSSISSYEMSEGNFFSSGIVFFVIGNGRRDNMGDSRRSSSLSVSNSDGTVF